MSRDQIDDEAYHSEIKTIWAATEQKVEEVQRDQEVSEKFVTRVFIWIPINDGGLGWHGGGNWRNYQP